NTVRPVQQETSLQLGPVPCGQKNPRSPPKHHLSSKLWEASSRCIQGKASRLPLSLDKCTDVHQHSFGERAVKGNPRLLPDSPTSTTPAGRPQYPGRPIQHRHRRTETTRPPRFGQKSRGKAVDGATDTMRGKVAKTGNPFAKPDWSAGTVGAVCK